MLEGFLRDQLHLTEIELAAYVTGHLEPEEARHANSHLPWCSDCREAVALVREAVGAPQRGGQARYAPSVLREIVVRIESLSDRLWPVTELVPQAALGEDACAEEERKANLCEVLSPETLRELQTAIPWLGERITLVRQPSQLQPNRANYVVYVDSIKASSESNARLAVTLISNNDGRRAIAYLDGRAGRDTSGGVFDQEMPADWSQLGLELSAA